MFRSFANLGLASFLSSLCLVTTASVPSAWAVDPTSAPRPIPLTRPEMKQYLEDMKTRTPRFALPELTEEEKTKLGERSNSYESRLRALYMPAGDSRGGFSVGGAGTDGRRPGSSRSEGTRTSGSGGFGRDSDPTMTLDYKFKTQLFWIVSRTNNCQY